MYQLFIFSAVLLSTYFVSTLGQANYPTLNNLAATCQVNLKGKKILEKCQNQSLAKWNTDKKHENEGTIRDMCCEIYDEIDCVKKAANTTCRQPNKGPFMAYQTKLINYWSSTNCKSIKYHGSQCNSASNHLVNLGIFLFPLIAVIFRINA